MNQNLKNVFSFIKEALELKNKNIYDVSNYELHYDYGSFYNQFKELIEIPDYNSLNINSDGSFFKLKYIKEDNKKTIPDVPAKLREYIFIKDKNDIISKVDDLEFRELLGKKLVYSMIITIFKRYDLIDKDKV